MRILNTITAMAIVGFLASLLGACAGNNTYNFALYNRGIDVSATAPAEKPRVTSAAVKPTGSWSVPVTCHYTDC